MDKLILIALGIATIKVLAFYIINKTRTIPKRTLEAEEVIRCGHMNPTLYKKQLENTIIDYTRDEEIEKEYLELRDLFKTKLQSKEISRGQLIGIEKYLREQLNVKKNYKNNAHAIYSMLKLPTLTYNHISTIEKFLYK